MILSMPRPQASIMPARNEGNVLGYGLTATPGNSKAHVREQHGSQTHRQKQDNRKTTGHLDEHRIHSGDQIAQTEASAYFLNGSASR